MSLSKHFKKAPKIRVMYNVASFIDIPTGRWYRGAHGESINCGGISAITGVGGQGNTFKSTAMHHLNLKILDRYDGTDSNVYDTEMSLTAERMYQLAAGMPKIGGVDLEEEGRLVITDSTVMSGNVWFDALKKFAADKAADKKNIRTLPFLDPETRASGKPTHLTTLLPTVIELDSLSMFITDSVQGIYEKNQLGDGGANTDALRSAAVKTQMLMQLPTLTAQYGVYFMTSAHVGKQHQLDQYAPPAKQLMFLKGQKAFKNVPEKFSFLTNNLYYVHSAEVFINRNTKAAEYPYKPGDETTGDTDLMLLTMQNLRAKSGGSGMPFNVVVSQNEGLLEGLTELVMLKQFDRFGLGGNNTNYFLDLLPSVSLGRTTVRQKLRENPVLCRAMAITCELALMYNHGYRTETTFEKKSPTEGEEEQMERDYVCTAKELYDDLIAKGYDWDVLLNTRGYWVFREQEESELPFLSTMDLLRMRAGLYHPWWHPPVTPKK